MSAGAPLSVSAMREAQATASAALLDGYAGVETPSQALGEVLARSLTDIALLEVRRGEHRFTTAGIPWFVGLFGRDSLLPTIQCLAYNPALGARTTKALAHWQGTKERPRHPGGTRQDPARTAGRGTDPFARGVANAELRVGRCDAPIPDRDCQARSLDRRPAGLQGAPLQRRSRPVLAGPQDGRGRGGIRHL